MEELIRCNSCGLRLPVPIPDRCSHCRAKLTPEGLYRERTPSPWRAGVIAVVVVLVLFWGSKLIQSWTAN